MSQDQTYTFILLVDENKFSINHVVLKRLIKGLRKYTVFSSYLFWFIL